MNKADYFVVLRETFDEIGENNFYLAYIYADSVKEDAQRIQGSPDGWIDIFAGKDETSVLSRAHTIYESLIVDYSDGQLSGRVF